MEAGTYAELAEALPPKWCVIALNQRAHGHNDHAEHLSWDAFIGDFVAFLEHLDIEGPAALAGNSLGGIVAFRFAARFPAKVRAMIVEAAPAVVDGDMDVMRQWGGSLPNARGAQSEGWRAARLVGRAVVLSDFGRVGPRFLSRCACR